jgi:hypothetical protein
VIDSEKAAQYLQNGAQPSDRVARLFKQEGIKLPDWVKLDEPRKRDVRNPEKRRSTAPEQPAEAPAPPAASEEPAEAETPAEEPAKEAESPDETPSEAEVAGPEAPGEEAPAAPETPVEPAEEPAEGKTEEKPAES